MTPEEEIAELERKLTASQRRRGYEQRVKAIEERLAELRS